ncbi:hypothetical protein OH77DRAFT_401294 [Trametes cingulata]|nr:hypothetical protein OH77DRAFT_401294 [Trametes cingulata]
MTTTMVAACQSLLGASRPNADVDTLQGRERRSVERRNGARCPPSNRRPRFMDSMAAQQGTREPCSVILLVCRPARSTRLFALYAHGPIIHGSAHAFPESCEGLCQRGGVITKAGSLFRHLVFNRTDQPGKVSTNRTRRSLEDNGQRHDVRPSLYHGVCSRRAGCQAAMKAQTAYRCERRSNATKRTLVPDALHASAPYVRLKSRQRPRVRGVPTNSIAQVQRPRFNQQQGG